MAFNNRVAVPLDYNTSPLLPQADASQAHDIPTGISPTTAKLQDWIAWHRANGVFFASGTAINSDITVNGNLEVTGTLGAAGAVNFGSSLAVGTTITGASVNVSGALAAGTSISGGTLAVTGGASVGTNLVATGFLSGSYVNITGTQPTSSADPGANRLHGTGIVKAWGSIDFAAGVVTVLDGYNVTSVAISLSSIGVVTLARAMANANYAVTISVGGTDHAQKYATVQNTGKTTTAFQFNVWDAVAGAVVDLSSGSTDLVVSFCVMGRQ